MDKNHQIQIKFVERTLCHCGQKIHSTWAYKELNGRYSFQLECIDCTIKYLQLSAQQAVGADLTTLPQVEAVEPEK